MTPTCHTRAWRDHRHALRAFLARHLDSRSEADDLLQEIFLKALQQGKGFCAIDNPRAWLFRVARNLLIDRARLARAEVVLPDDLVAEGAAETAPVDGLTHCLARVLSELSPDDREAITLCDLQGMTQQAYARQLGLSLAAAKSRVQRARARLQAQLVGACQVRFDESGKVCSFVARPALTRE